MRGHKAGQQSGDIVFTFKNLALAIIVDYFAGQNLDMVLSYVIDFLSKLEIYGLQMFSKIDIAPLTSHGLERRIEHV